MSVRIAVGTRLWAGLDKGKNYGAERDMIELNFKIPDELSDLAEAVAATIPAVDGESTTDRMIRATTAWWGNIYTQAKRQAEHDAGRAKANAAEAAARNKVRDSKIETAVK
jgi:hypothetical protein